MLIDASKIDLKENIPLTYQEKEECMHQVKSLRKVAPFVSAFAVGTIIIMRLWASDWRISNYETSDNILFFSAMLLSFFALIGIFYLYSIFWKNKFLKDFKIGKQILISYIIDKDSTENETMLTFALPNNNKIRLSASIKDYSHFKKGDFVQVSFLTHDKSIIKIFRLNENS